MARGGKVPIMVRFLLLWLALALFAALSIAAPGLPVAMRSPLMAVAVSSMAGVIGLALACLGVWRFHLFGRVFDLFAGLAFGTLAASNLLLGVLIPLGLLPLPVPQSLVYLVLLKRTLGGGLLLGGLLAGDASVASPLRTRAAWGSAAVVGAGLALATGGILADAAPRARLLGAEAQDLLARGEVIVDFLPGQHPALVVAGGGLVALYLFTTLACVVLYQRRSDPETGWLAVALSLLACSQLFAVLFPPVATDYVNTGDALRLAAYLVLLFSLVAGLIRELVQRVSQQERLRISQDLHDGLTQHVGLLNLRLARAAAPGRPPQDRLRDLEAARRIAERAMVEARQIITTLRVGLVSRETLAESLAGFAEEFGRNHDVDVVTAITGDLSSVRAADQADLLRIVSETASNAVRHGRASRIEIGLTLQRGSLELRVGDNGSGFDPEEAMAAGGVGLRSLHERLGRRGGQLFLDAAPGRGTTVRALLPLPGP